MPSPNLAAVSSLTPTVLCSTQIGVTTSVAVYTVPASTGAIIKQGSLCNVSGLVVAPVVASAVGSTTGGALAAATYYYKVTALLGTGETLASNEVSATTTGTTSSIVLTWAAVAGATGYKVYRGTAAGAESVLVATFGAVATYTDTGAATTASSPPAVGTAAQAVTVSVSVVPAGGSADGTHRVISGYSLGAGDTLPLASYLGGMCLGPADAVHVVAGAVNAVDVVLTGMVNA